MGVERVEWPGFVPTSTGPRWRGKYRCAYCNVDGWISENWLHVPRWWGHRHGENCKKRPDGDS